MSNDFSLSIYRCRSTSDNLQTITYYLRITIHIILPYNMATSDLLTLYLCITHSFLIKAFPCQNPKTVQSQLLAMTKPPGDSDIRHSG